MGQYTKFAGVEREPEGAAQNCHFAGEHTSIESQGYLNGGVETGERAASEIIDALGWGPEPCEGQPGRLSCCAAACIAISPGTCGRCAGPHGRLDGSARPAETAAGA